MGKAVCNCLSLMYLFKGSVKWNFASTGGVSSRVVFNGVSHSTWYICTQHTVKFQKKSPGAYIFQRPFMRGLFLEGPLFRGAYVRREICVIKSVGLDCSGEEIYHFRFVLHCIRGANSKYKPPGELIFGGAYTWRGLFSEFYGITVRKLEE